MKNTTGSLLIVDDEETMRRSLGEILRLEGYSIQLAASGEEACALILGERLSSSTQNATSLSYDLVILDLKMPGMDGLEVLEKITNPDFYTKQITHQKRLTRLPDVILLTAHGSLESAISAIRHGVVDFLQKPCSPQEIISTVAKCLDNRRIRIKRDETLRRLELRQKRNKNINAHQTADSLLNEMIAKIDISQPEDEKVIKFENIHLEVNKREITDHFNVVQLTLSETRFLQALMSRPGHVFTHKDLVRVVQGYEVESWEAPQILRPLVSRLRRKLSPLKLSPDLTSEPRTDSRSIASRLRNIRSTGYLIDVQER